MSSDILETGVDCETNSGLENGGCKYPVDCSEAISQKGEEGEENKSPAEEIGAINDGVEQRKFYVLDELDNSSEGGGDNGDYDTDVDESDIDEMLEEGLKANPPKRAKLDETVPEDSEKSEENKEPDFITRSKFVLVEKVQNHFEVLSEGWIKITHKSGIPIYLHRPTRVCTLSRPYPIGNASARNHLIPASAVPCLEYRRALEAEGNHPESMVVNGVEVPRAKILSSEENNKTNMLTAEDVREYCSKLFQFKKIECLRFATWLDRRNFHRKQRALQKTSLPDGSKLIACPIKDGKSRRSEWIINPNGKTYICILHDYVQRALKKKVVYGFKELDNTATPYMVTISIDGMEYGKGVGASKKLAKMEAAKATLDILIPGMKTQIVENPKRIGKAGGAEEKTGLEFFDDIPIQDPRVIQFCEKTTEPLPHAILLTCLQRNFGINDRNVEYNVKTVKHGKNFYTLTVGKHTATVECQNKKEGKHRASQALLQALHPHINSWGSLLRLYGNSSVKSYSEKKCEEQEITSLQSRGDPTGPNVNILNKLKEEMLKLKEAKNDCVPIGIFMAPGEVKIPNPSSIDLDNVTI